MSKIAKAVVNGHAGFWLVIVTVLLSITVLAHTFSPTIFAHYAGKAEVAIEDFFEINI